MLDKGIHFVFQHVPFPKRVQWFLKCWDTWKDSFIPEDSIVLIQSGDGRTTLPEPNCEYREIYTDKLMLAASKRSIGVALAEKEYTMLIDDDILLLNKDWRKLVQEAIEELSINKNRVGLFNIAPFTEHYKMGRVSVNGFDWYRMDRIGLNAVLAPTLLWKAFPHLNYTTSADKTIMDFFSKYTELTLWYSVEKMTEHLSIDDSLFHNRKYRDIRRHKNEWFLDYAKQILGMEKLLKEQVKHARLDKYEKL